MPNLILLYPNITTAVNFHQLIPLVHVVIWLFVVECRLNELYELNKLYELFN